MQKLHDELLHYQEHRGKGLTLRARSPENHITCLLDWMLEDEGESGIPHFVAGNISWLYPLDPKKINCSVAEREQILSFCDSGYWGTDAEDGANATGLLSNLCSNK